MPNPQLTQHVSTLLISSKKLVDELNSLTLSEEDKVFLQDALIEIEEHTSKLITIVLE